MEQAGVPGHSFPYTSSTGTCVESAERLSREQLTALLNDGKVLPVGTNSNS
jgi:hypothetical protein